MYTLEELKKSTLIELRNIASTLKLDGYEKLKKEYLIEEIIKSLQGTNSLDEKIDVQIENPETDYIAEGILEVMPDGYGFLRGENYLSSDKDVYISMVQIRRFRLDTGDIIKGISRYREGEKFPSLIFVGEVNGEHPEKAMKRKRFDELTPIYPTEKLKLETTPNDYATRIIDLMCPIGKGQRGMIVAPPKVGKTTLLKKVAMM